jgi:hypothetical protein
VMLAAAAAGLAGASGLARRLRHRHHQRASSPRVSHLMKTLPPVSVA